MTKLLVGEELGIEIRKLLSEPDVRCAVAFWGVGAEGLVTGTSARIICNLGMGGSNPFVLREVEAEIRRRDDLHAKVYLGKNVAIVTSANAYANGLGLEGVEQAGWIEAGIAIHEIAPLSDWFEALWSSSEPISKADWAAAEKAWRARTKPTLATFASFDPNVLELPLINWVQRRDWETCPEAIEAKFGAVNDELVRQVDEGLELEHPDDEAVLVGCWVLCWIRGKHGPPPIGGRPWWVRLGNTTLKGVFCLDGETRKRDVVMAAEIMPPVPFDPTERRFVAAFREVLSRPKYADFLIEDYEAPWFKSRVKRMASFWRDVKAVYLRN